MRAQVAIERRTGQMVAVKILDKASGECALFTRAHCLFCDAVQFKYTGGTHSGEQLMREVDILKSLSHPNIIRVLDVLDTERML